MYKDAGNICSNAGCAAAYGANSATNKKKIINIKLMEMTIALVKETHTENKQVRYSIERDGQFVDGTLTVNEYSAHRMYEAMKQTTTLHSKNTIWKKEVLEEINM